MREEELLSLACKPKTTVWFSHLMLQSISQARIESQRRRSRWFPNLREAKFTSSTRHLGSILPRSTVRIPSPSALFKRRIETCKHFFGRSKCGLPHMYHRLLNNPPPVKRINADLEIKNSDRIQCMYNCGWFYAELNVLRGFRHWLLWELVSSPDNVTHRR